jgi:hypothetical protein
MLGVSIFEVVDYLYGLVKFTTVMLEESISFFNV